MMEPIMSRKTGLPKGVTTDTARDGSVRYRFRVGGRRIALPGPALSDAFWAAYAAARAGQSLPARDGRKAPDLVQKGSLAEMVAAHYRSAAFKALDALTQADRRGVYASIMAEPLIKGEPLLFETCPVKSISRKHVAVLRDRKADHPSAATKRVRYLSSLFKWAIDAGMASENPAKDVAKIRTTAKGAHTWTIDEIRQYEAHHAPGTTARLAFGLIIYAGLRRSDVCQVGRQHIRTIDGEPWLVLPQHKNRRRQGKILQIPILPELQALIDATPSSGLSLIETAYGQPFSIKGFGERFKGWCRAAGLPHCSAHGGRKAAATISLHGGASDAQAMGAFGWETPAQIRTYTRDKDTRRLAKGGIDALAAGLSEIKNVPRGTPAKSAGQKG